jgi:hypothetical protein
VRRLPWFGRLIETPWLVNSGHCAPLGRSASSVGAFWRAK